jgi:phospholipid transport system transporter-binding protein
MSAAAQARRDGDVLRVEGLLDRAAVPSVWAGLRPLLSGARSIDTSAVSRVDSAGLALLAELAAAGLPVVGAPAGLAELSAAYRLDASLGFGPAA